MNLSIRRLFVSWFGFWIAFAAIALYLLYPLRTKLKYGIDLVGGTYITLGVQTEKAVEDELTKRSQSLVQHLKDKQLPKPTSQKITQSGIEYTFSSKQDAQEVLPVLQDYVSSMNGRTNGQMKVVARDANVNLELSKSFISNYKQAAVESIIEVLTSRLDSLGVAGVPIAQQGDNRIVIELPDIDDPQKAKDLIGKPAVLEFKLVEKEANNEQDLLDDFDGELPEDLMILPSRDKYEGVPKTYYLVSRFAEVVGKDLRSVRSGMGGEARLTPAVFFEFSKDVADQFYELTSKNIGREIAIILDNQVISAPNVRSGIRESGEITMGRGANPLEAAKELATLLKSGAFVAPVFFEEERQIGPSLGYESIKKGLISCLIGLGFLLLFSLYYYKVAGFFAFLALVYNLILVLFILSQFHATLTLPGIAGLVLTVGMAIDASILIYERIKEELAKGKSMRDSIKVGFSDAMIVILDANITTLIVGIVLFKFGTGPVKGFAVTMMVGIISTLITGLFFLRALFFAVLDGLGVQKIKF